VFDVVEAQVVAGDCQSGFAEQPAPVVEDVGVPLEVVLHGGVVGVQPERGGGLAVERSEPGLVEGRQRRAELLGRLALPGGEDVLAGASDRRRRRLCR
jgi:hypothetical protein